MAITEKREEQDYVKKKGNENQGCPDTRKVVVRAGRRGVKVNNRTRSKFDASFNHSPPTTTQPPVTPILLTLHTRAEFKYTLRGPRTFRYRCSTRLFFDYFLHLYPQKKILALNSESDSRNIIPQTSVSRITNTPRVHHEFPYPVVTFAKSIAAS